MEVFRDLYISIDPARMSEGVDQMGCALPAGWSRDREAEENARAAPGKARPTCCFICTQEGRRPAAVLVLASKDPATFYVSNIVPVSKHQLSRAEYNAVLEEFYQRVLRPYAERAGFVTSLTEADVGLEHWMSPETAEKLRTFSACANKSTGAS